MPVPFFHFLLRLVVVGLFLGGCAPFAHAEPTPSGELRLQSPSEYEVFQRATAARGRIRVQGELNCVVQGQGPLQLQARLHSGSRPGRWRTLARLGSGKSYFDIDWEVPAGGWYRIEVQAVHGRSVLAAREVQRVGVGEVFVIAGQSNSANHGEERLQTETGRVATKSSTGWALAHDPQPGASGNGGSFIPAFADQLVRRFDVPVGIVAAGVGATSVREWLPAGITFERPPTLTGNVRQRTDGLWESKGDLFTRLVERMTSLGRTGCRAVLWHQGESDANQADPSRTLPGADYARLLTEVIRRVSSATGRITPWFVAQASYHTPEDPGSPEIRQAQASLWESGVALRGPDTDALTGVNRDMKGRGVHFSGAGLRTHGALWAANVEPWLTTRLRRGR